MALGPFLNHLSFPQVMNQLPVGFASFPMNGLSGMEQSLTIRILPGSLHPGRCQSWLVVM